MTRYGMNPARNKTISYTPSRVTATMVTYIPNMEGYFRHRFQVLKLSLASLVHTVDDSCDIMVLNNGSCPEVTAYLESLLENGSIQYLIHSQQNLGVIGAFKILFNAVPGELIAYSDDDVLYFPDWISAHMRIYDAFPDVGMISGAPVGFSSEHAFQAVETFLTEKKDVQQEAVPRHPTWEEDWARSTGRSPQDHLKDIQDKPLTRITYQGIAAVQSAKHFQFMAPKDVMRRALSGAWTGSLMDGLVSLDEAIDAMGFLRLSTPERYTRHIGNAVSEEILQAADSIGISMDFGFVPVEEQEHWLLRIPGSGRILWPLYNWLFRVLHKVK